MKNAPVGSAENRKVFATFADLTADLMRKAILTVLLLLLATGMRAQLVEYCYFEARGSYNGTWSDSSFEGKLTGDFLNFHLKGQLAPGLSYRIRQRFTKPLYDPKVPLNATDLLTLTWDINEKWSLDAGKLPVFIGGFEWDDAPIDLYYFSDFAKTIPQVYALGGTAYFRPVQNQTLHLQVTQSLLAEGNWDAWNASLGWTGQFFNWWKTLWGINFMDDPYHHMMGYLALGNRFEAGPVALELDGMYRRSFKHKKAGLDLTVIGKLEYKVGKFTLFAKGGYDTNAANNVDEEGIAYDLTVAPGSSILWGGGGLEFFPLRNQDLRIHTVVYGDNFSKSVIVKAGLTFRLYLKRPLT